MGEAIRRGSFLVRQQEALQRKEKENAEREKQRIFNEEEKQRISRRTGKVIMEVEAWLEANYQLVRDIETVLGKDNRITECPIQNTLLYKNGERIRLILTGELGDGNSIYYEIKDVENPEEGESPVMVVNVLPERQRVSRASLLAASMAAYALL